MRDDAQLKHLREITKRCYKNWGATVSNRRCPSSRAPVSPPEIGETEIVTFFGERLRDLRKQAGWTQSELAERSHVTLFTIRNYEQQKVRGDISLAKAAKMAWALGVSLDVFVYCRDILDRHSSQYGGQPVNRKGRPKSGRKQKGD